MVSPRMVVTHDGAAPAEVVRQARLGSGGRARWWWRRLVLLAVSAAVLAFAAHCDVVASAAPFLRERDAAPACDVILVPGARVHEGGRPSHMLIDRLRTAAELFAAGKAPRLVLSGRGGGGADQDEVAAMRRWLLDAGVPASALVDDPLGLRTVDTMRRARGVFGARTALLVSNPFHVARAVFLGRACGLEVYGVGAPAGFVYSRSVLWRNHGREVLARLWAWLEVRVLRRGDA